MKRADMIMVACFLGIAATRYVNADCPEVPYISAPCVPTGHTGTLMSANITGSCLPSTSLATATSPGTETHVHSDVPTGLTWKPDTQSVATVGCYTQCDYINCFGQVGHGRCLWFTFQSMLECP